ncbi:MAG: type I restriction endonuclease subunit R [Chloroflexota bacterium]|nr:type I restriction endonuclease subunit R [Chloroflexota bacterium]
MPKTTENTLEYSILEWLQDLGYQTGFAPDLVGIERSDQQKVILAGRLRSALTRINPGAAPQDIKEALLAVSNPETPDLLINNRTFHHMLTDGIDIEVPASDGIGTRYEKLWLLDLDDINNNDWLALNQFTVVESVSGRQHTRRADVVVFVNGIPLAVLELKNPADENANTRDAFQQLQTYKTQIPSLFTTNELLVASDGVVARAGSLSAGWGRFMPWRTVDGSEILPKGTLELEVLIRGMFEKHRFLDYILNFVVFEDRGKIIKISAAYHQYWAVNKAVGSTFYACGIHADADRLLGRFPAKNEPQEHVIKDGIGNYVPHAFGDQRIGVIWHTQGSGKSLSMVFYAGKIIRHPAMGNPTVVVITDRNDLDNQLSATFAACKDVLRQVPVQADSRADLRSLLQVASGGVIFTTIQKFMPDVRGDTHQELSDRKNIVVIADEAHRSQYDFIDGFARHLHDALPNASFIGFTGTPIEKTDRSTPAVFGNYIDTYDILRAVEDETTVPIYYENRLARIELNADEKPYIDPEFEKITEGEEVTIKKKLKAKWAAQEALVGAEKRINLVAEDLVNHFEARLSVIDGKGMIVCMSRRICVEMYDAVARLRPAWCTEDDASGKLKVVMSGSASDDLSWQTHIRSKQGREALAKRFKDENDELQLVIVCDMWLTGFDCPSLHTMYVDKPMSGHNLMQAIARVNRVFKDKQGGLIVDYIGIADSLKKALMNYTDSGGAGEPAIDQEQAVNVLREKVTIVKDMLHGFDYLCIIDKRDSARLHAIAEAMEFILELEDGKQRYLEAVTNVTKAFSLAVPHDYTKQIRDEVRIFQEIRSMLAKSVGSDDRRDSYAMETAIKQLVSRAVASTEVLDIFKAVGMESPDISILSEEFLAEVQNLKQKNLAFELLKKLLNDEIKARSRRNIVEARKFSEMLEQAVVQYQKRAITSAEVIDELIKLAKDIKKARERGESLNLNDDELAFYDALAENESARDVMGDDQLCVIAHELLEKVKSNVTIDWELRESARAKIRILVKHILRKYGYPPDLQKAATQLVLEQAEVLCDTWGSTP